MLSNIQWKVKKTHSTSSFFFFKKNSRSFKKYSSNPAYYSFQEIFSFQMCHLLLIEHLNNFRRYVKSFSLLHHSRALHFTQCSLLLMNQCPILVDIFVLINSNTMLKLHLLAIKLSFKIDTQYLFLCFIYFSWVTSRKI